MLDVSGNYGALRTSLGTPWPVLRRECSSWSAGDQIVTTKRCLVLDVVFVAVSILFFVVSIGYVAACDRLMK